MLSTQVPIISATDLMVFTMLFDRRKDWADIEELVRYGSPDVAAARDLVAGLLGEDDQRLRTLDQLLREVAPEP